MWTRQRPLKGNANTSWKQTHQSFIIKNLYYLPELKIMGVLSLPVRGCLFNTVKIEDKGDLRKLFMLFQIQVLIWVFSLSVLSH